jgi:hypothetical protein
MATPCHGAARLGTESLQNMHSDSSSHVLNFARLVKSALHTDILALLRHEGKTICWALVCSTEYTHSADSHSSSRAPTTCAKTEIPKSGIKVLWDAAIRP